MTSYEDITLDEAYGPTLKVSKDIHSSKYRGEGESFYDCQTRVANALQDDLEHFYDFRDILLKQRFMPGGRVQAAVGSPRKVTPFNCFVSEKIEDDFSAIMDRVKDAGKTMRVGGGIGYDFSTLRPRGDRIVSLDSQASGPVSFMQIFNATCNTVAGAGHRRGAQMGVLRVDHPDIEEFIRAKHKGGVLEAFNISVGITDEFMVAVQNDEMFDLSFEGRVYKQIHAPSLWEEIMRGTWEWAEPGVLFLDTINKMNNLWYCETLEATNPCGEQPLPPGGACLLGSFNLTKYVSYSFGGYVFNLEQFKADIPVVVRAMDNIHDSAAFPLEIQKKESHDKRRMGLGVTGVANAIEALGFPYGSPKFLETFNEIMSVLANECYRASALLAKEKGHFPLYDPISFGASRFLKMLKPEVLDLITEYGIRNSHLLSIAPTGTISLAADNCSGGIEPVFSYAYDRTIQTMDGPIIEHVEDYGVRVFGVKGKKASECTAEEHLSVLEVASRWVDSSVSKTINVNPKMGWDDFKEIYMTAWRTGCKGCTTFNPEGKRYGILNEKKEPTPVEDDPIVVPSTDEAKACFIDPETGQKECA